MARELVNPPELHPAPGFSHVATADGTRVVHLAGQLGLNPDFSLAAVKRLGAEKRRLVTDDEFRGLL